MFYSYNKGFVSDSNLLFIDAKLDSCGNLYTVHNNQRLHVRIQCFPQKSHKNNWLDICAAHCNTKLDEHPNRSLYVKQSQDFRLSARLMGLVFHAKLWVLPMQPSPLGCRVYPGEQMHMYVPIRFLQVMPLLAQSSIPSSHSFWSAK